MLEPVFIFSLPRSGSTLLQRLISGHSKVASVAEPWILLPLAEFGLGEHVRGYSNYSSKDAAKAREHLFANSLSGETGATELISNFARSIYAEAAKADGKDGALFFLDKTPRYYLIIDFINDIFPNSKKIFLTRHLDSVFASIMNTWYQGALRLNHHHVDVSMGPKLLYEGWVKNRTDSIHISYEQLTLDPTKVMKSLFDYLELFSEGWSIEQSLLETIPGTMGDPVNRTSRDIRSKQSLSDSDIVLDTFAKQFVMKRLEASLGSSVVEFFGMTHDYQGARRLGPAMKELDDLFGLVASAMYRKFQVSLVRSELEASKLSWAQKIS